VVVRADSGGRGLAIAGILTGALATLVMATVVN
jgi:hypothetical protein